MPACRPAALVAALMLTTARAAAQQGGDETLEDLRHRLELLERDHEEEVESLHDEIDSLSDQIAENARRAQATPQRANVFNPGITVFGNFLGRMDDGPVYLEDDPANERIDDRMNLREVEIDLRAAVDPWASGVLITSFESEVPGEYGASVEEGYLDLTRLPVLDTAPAGLKLRVGRFRPAFGRFNSIHLHDLPQPSYPRALGTLLGEEGYIQSGVAGQFFLPSPSETQTIEAVASVLDGGGLPVAESQSASELAVLGHLKWFRDAGTGSNVELGASAWQSDADHRLYGLDATYKWKPFAAGEWNSFLVGGELFAADLSDPATSSSPVGYYLWSQVQFDRNLYLGTRYDVSEDLVDDSLETSTLGLYLTWYTTEFLRLRLGVEHVESDDSVLDGNDALLVELNYVFGSHPVEPYWVNR